MGNQPNQTPEPEVLLTPAEVAAIFRVDVKTVSRWDKDNMLPEGAVLRTPGGHRRFRRAVLEQRYPAAFRNNGDGPE